MRSTTPHTATIISYYFTYLCVLYIINSSWFFGVFFLVCDFSYQPTGMFSMAVRVPDNQNQNKNINQILATLLRDDPPTNVLNKVRNSEVYVGTWLVEAVKVDGPPLVHSEAGVAQHLNDLLRMRNNNVPDWLIFYAFASPCDQRCTNSQHPANILTSINVMNQWPTRFFVFSKIFRPRSGSAIPVESLSESLQRLGTVIGKENIFRCDQGTCTPCFNGNVVSTVCVSD